MAKKLISYDDQKPGLGLPDPVEERLVEYLGPSAGIIGVISDTEPAETIRDGMPVVWFKTVSNTIPDVESFTLAGKGLTVTATFTGSDPDGDELTWTVDWGDGTVDTNATTPATHAYMTEGKYTVTLSVTDTWGATATTTSTLYVAAPIADRWGFDSFSYPDGTILAGWTTNLAQDPAVSLEEGELVWGPGDQTTGGNQLYQKAHVAGGKFVEGTPEGTVDGAKVAGAMIALPGDSYQVAFRYRITPDGVRNALARASLYLACAPVTARNTVDTTSLSIRVTDAETIQIHTQSDGVFTTVDTISGVPRAGLLQASFDAVTGAVTVRVDGNQVWSGTYAGPAYPKIGIDTRLTATIDDFEVGPL